MTSKLVVNSIEADTGISSVSFASSISLSSTSVFHLGDAGINIGADTNISRIGNGVLGFNINGTEKARIDTNGTITATSFVGSGANLTGIDATSIKHTNGDVRAQATASGVNITGNLGLGNTTTAGRNAGVSTVTGSIIYNTSDNKLQVYNGTEWLNIKTLLNTFNVSYLIIGGGGAGGGNYRAGGGGAGGYLTNWNNENQGGGQATGAAFTVDPNGATTFAVEVGSGGSPSQSSAGGAGGQSRFAGLIADGGGGGGRYEAAAPAYSGNGAGGGGGGHNNGSETNGGGSGTYGYNAGNGSGSGSYQCGGGGGGAGGAGITGYNSSDNGLSGDGGAALASTITGNSVLRAGGGGAGAYGGGNNFPIGGGGGAGTGEYGYSGANNGTAATANTGSGGGGSPGDNTATGGAGGSGVVILRYDSSVTATYSSGVVHTTQVVGGDRVDTITSTSNNSQTVTFS